MSICVIVVDEASPGSGVVCSGNAVRNAVGGVQYGLVCISDIISDAAVLKSKNVTEFVEAGSWLPVRRSIAAHGVGPVEEYIKGLDVLAQIALSVVLELMDGVRDTLALLNRFQALEAVTQVALLDRAEPASRQVLLELMEDGRVQNLCKKI